MEGLGKLSKKKFNRLLPQRQDVPSQGDENSSALVPLHRLHSQSSLKGQPLGELTNNLLRKTPFHEDPSTWSPKSLPTPQLPITPLRRPAHADGTKNQSPKGQPLALQTAGSSPQKQLSPGRPLPKLVLYQNQDSPAKTASRESNSGNLCIPRGLVYQEQSKVQKKYTSFRISNILETEPSWPLDLSTKSNKTQDNDLIKKTSVTTDLTGHPPPKTSRLSTTETQPPQLGYQASPTGHDRIPAYPSDIPRRSDFVPVSHYGTGSTCHQLTYNLHISHAMAHVLGSNSEPLQVLQSHPVSSLYTSSQYFKRPSQGNMSLGVDTCVSQAAYSTPHGSAPTIGAHPMQGYYTPQSQPSSIHQQGTSYTSLPPMKSSPPAAFTPQGPVETASAHPLYVTYSPQSFTSSGNQQGRPTSYTSMLPMESQVPKSTTMTFNPRSALVPGPAADGWQSGKEEIDTSKKSGKGMPTPSQNRKLEKNVAGTAAQRDVNLPCVPVNPIHPTLIPVTSDGSGTSIHTQCLMQSCPQSNDMAGYQSQQQAISGNQRQDMTLNSSSHQQGMMGHETKAHLPIANPPGPSSPGGGKKNGGKATAAKRTGGNRKAPDKRTRKASCITETANHPASDGSVVTASCSYHTVQVPWPFTSPSESQIPEPQSPSETELQTSADEQDDLDFVKFKGRTPDEALARIELVHDLTNKNLVTKGKNPIQICAETYKLIETCRGQKNVPIRLMNEGYGFKHPFMTDPAIFVTEKIIQSEDGKTKKTYYYKGTCLKETDRRSANRYARRQDKCIVCIYCENRFGDATDLTRHTRTHTDVRPYRCSVNDCPIKHRQLVTLENHMLNKHGIQKPKKFSIRPKRYACEFTAQIFWTAEELMDHDKRGCVLPHLDMESRCQDKRIVKPSLEPKCGS